MNVARTNLMATGLAKAIGKRIAHFFLAEHEHRYQFYIVFDDGTSYELWNNGELFQGAGVLDRDDADTIRARLIRERKEGAGKFRFTEIPVSPLADR
jgi:hypothetical protein